MRVILTAIMVASSVVPLWSDDGGSVALKVEQNPREVVEEFLEMLASGDKIDATQWFTTGDTKVTRQANWMRQIVPHAKVPIAAVYAAESRALAITKLLSGRLVKGNAGVFVIDLEKSPQTRLAH